MNARAPSIDIFGSFFPSWMLCLAAAIVFAFVVRFVLLRLRMEAEVVPGALFYPALVLLIASLLWLGFFQ